MFAHQIAWRWQLMRVSPLPCPPDATREGDAMMQHTAFTFSREMRRNPQNKGEHAGCTAYLSLLRRRSRSQTISRHMMNAPRTPACPSGGQLVHLYEPACSTQRSQMSAVGRSEGCSSVQSSTTMGNTAPLPTITSTRSPPSNVIGQ